ncbi:MAG: hypothetical protein IJ386_08390, partial [Clostridia bacterium]|nr:hypothetical protein [Clostridia bacterium]
MEKIKLLEVGYEYYRYPEGVSDIEGFVALAAENYHGFVKMEMFDTENCNFPYLIKEEASERYVNIAKMTYFREVTATVLTKDEYDLRLKEIVQSKCTGCVSYT